MALEHGQGADLVPAHPVGRRDALAAMLERYLHHQRAGDPVHTWPVP
jgi:hypothetical protein